MDGSPKHSASRAPSELPEGAYELARLSGELLHDLNNALATLSALAEIAEAEARDGMSTVASIDRIRTACGHLRGVVRDVSDAMLGRSTSPEVEFEPHDAARAALDQWIVTAPALEVSFHCELPSGARVRGRESFFFRALSNLLQNAARHANREIRVRIRYVLQDSGPEMVLSVEDDGVGVQEALAGRLFEAFVHGGHGGSGLGLSTVRWSAEQLGGSVEVGERSLLGGAQFLIRLPLRISPSASNVRPTAASGGSPLTDCRIVVVDDDPALRRLYGRLLSRDGAVAVELVPEQTETAESMAIQIASASADAVLLDAEMGSFDGIEVWQALRSLSPTLAARCLVISGHVPASAHSIGDLAGRWMVKDAEWSAVRAAILDVLRKPD